MEALVVYQLAFIHYSWNMSEILSRRIKIWCHYRQESCRRLLRAYEELMRDYQKWSSDTKH